MTGRDSDDGEREPEPRRGRGQVAAIAFVALLLGLLAGFVAVAIASGDDTASRSSADNSDAPVDSTAEWRRVASPSGRYTVELPGRPVDDSGAIALGVDRSVPVSTRHVTTSDGTTATIAELDYSSVVGTDEYDLRLGAAAAVARAGGSMQRFDEATSVLGPAAAFGGAGEDVVIHGHLVANGGQVVLLLVTSPSAAAEGAGAAILRMVSTLAPA